MWLQILFGMGFVFAPGALALLEILWEVGWLFRALPACDDVFPIFQDYPYNKWGELSQSTAPDP